MITIPEQDGHTRAATIGWILSCTLHGTLVIVASLFVQRIQLAPQLEPFTWNVAMVSSEQAAPAPSQSTVQPKETVKSGVTEPVRHPVPSKPVQPVEAPQVMPTVAPPSPPQPVAAPIPAKVPVQPVETMPPPTPAPQVKAPELPPPTQEQLESVRSTQIESAPLPQHTVHERHPEPAHEEPIQPIPPIQDNGSTSPAELGKPELPQPVTSPQLASGTPSPQATLQSMAAESAAPHVAPTPEAAAPSGPPQVAALAPKTAPATPKPDYGWLSDTIVRRVEELKRYPADARLEQAQGKVIVKVVIQEDGNVIDVEVVKSSGFPSLDQAAMSLMHQAGPFHLTRPLGKPTLAVRVPINYAIDRP